MPQRRSAAESPKAGCIVERYKGIDKREAIDACVVGIGHSEKGHDSKTRPETTKHKRDNESQTRAVATSLWRRRLIGSWRLLQCRVLSSTSLQHLRGSYVKPPPCRIAQPTGEEKARVGYSEECQ